MRLRVEFSSPRIARPPLDQPSSASSGSCFAAIAGRPRGGLFGRMVTSDPAASTEAAIHVAHAFTVHAEQAETDYFTVVDDLSEGSGAGGIVALGSTPAAGPAVGQFSSSNFPR